MASALSDDEIPSGEIDMERVVADPIYRRRVISRLRRERILAKAQASEDDAFEALSEAAGEED
ncbi:MAG TPA: hypothetical protein VN802_05575 [Stellaceae bacterium]|nr:hypothetical protein [Stellaceae bacterium]